MKDDAIELSLNIKDDLKIFGFPNEYSQVLLNLISNSRDAILERRIKNPVIRICLFKENNKSVLTVTDNAGGVNSEIIDKIFNPYFTSKKSGTGIGLYMSKVIIEKNMGGTLTFKNVDNGAQFRIEV